MILQHLPPPLQRLNPPPPQLPRIPPKYLLLVTLPDGFRLRQPLDILIDVPEANSVRKVGPKHHLANWNLHSLRQPFDLLGPDGARTIVPKAGFVGVSCLVGDFGKPE